MSINHLVRSSACGLLWLGWATVAWGTTYYVAPPPAGSDANPGTSGAPWATLQHAADSVTAGDEVVVRAGDYVGAHVTVSGTAALRISLKAEDGALVRVTADNGTTPDGINLEGASFWVIEGFRIDGRGRAGIRAVLCEHVTIRGNHLDANERWGILTGFCDDLLIEDNVATNSVIEHGIYVSNSGDRPVIRGNLIFGNRANGIHMNADASQGGDGVISDALVENNIIYDNGLGGGSGINMDGVQDSLIRNNLIYDSHASGISLYRIDAGEPSTGNEVLNNTVLVAADGRWALNIQDGSTQNVIRNNIFYSEHPFRGSINLCSTCLAGFDSERNAMEDRFTLDDGGSVLDLAQWQTATGQDLASVVSTPAALFLNPGADSYRLIPGSVAVDAGEALAQVPTDLDGLRRPQGLGWDMGAFEGLEAIFADGFEDGDVLSWSSQNP